MTVMAAVAGGTRSDVVIVGGRVAGALTAAHLAATGMEVAVLDSSALTSGTIPTHFFRGDGLVRGLWNVVLLDEVLATGAPKLTCEYSYSTVLLPRTSIRRRSRRSSATASPCDARPWTRS